MAAAAVATLGGCSSREQEDDRRRRELHPHGASPAFDPREGKSFTRPGGLVALRRHADLRRATL